MARRAKSSADYWREREAEQRRHDITDRMAYNREVRRIYQSTQDNIQKEIDAFYGKYAEKEGITLAEAKRRVSRLEMEEYERKAARYVKEKNFSKQANEEMRLYNLTMKVNRLEMLKANIGLELTRGFDELDKTCGEKLNRHATKEFERLAGILGDSVRDNTRYVHAIVNASFHNATFSERIWTNQAALKASLDTQIQRGLIQGRNSLELARAIGREFEVSRRDAERLMITEMRRVRTEVAKQSYEENGNKEYQFLALGARPCDKCLDIDGQVFPVKEMMPGVNAPPMHPRCECTTAPYWDEDKFQAWLDSGAAADGVPWEEFEAGSFVQGFAEGLPFDRKTRLMTSDEDLSAVNPSREQPESKVNCQRCVPAYELRRRGYDVRAKSAKITESGKLSSQDVTVAKKTWNRPFKGMQWRQGPSRNRIETVMASWGDGARAEVYVKWVDGASHVFVAEQKNGHTAFIDPQTGNADCSSYFTKIVDSSTMFARIDNLEPIDEIDDFVEDVR